MIDDQTLLNRSFLSDTGMVSLHILRVGAPVNVERVIEQYVPMQSRWGWTMSAWDDGELVKRHHLNLLFPKRGVLDVQIKDKVVRGVLWMLQPGEKISAGIQDAADTFWGAFDVAPRTAVANKLPEGAPTELTLAGCCVGAVVKIMTKEKVPKAAVLVI